MFATGGADSSDGEEEEGEYEGEGDESSSDGEVPPPECAHNLPLLGLSGAALTGCM